MQAVATSLRAFGKRLVVQRDEPETVSPGGIALPETNDNWPATGTVLSIGPLVNKDASRFEDTIKEGARIYFHPYAGQAITHEGDEFHVITSDDVFAFVDA